ncbi:GNAT family N-acetyltransferase [Arthrobacter liuii]|uniref:N-acetyltransferase domain-containing protein n=1 Tax=Arthrobacter liuii TaxID=1476996 RepID=A0ABQ2AZC3_9MICC|nr:GNAT family N-acetyltransferase [Arthrobacter liuii]GGI00935.1 hypothetical protein GCM10007170_39230 [Arthrobacter liuii]
MNASITLRAATGPEGTTSDRVPLRPLEPADLPQLASLYRQAYAAQSGPRRLGRAVATDEDRTPTSDAASFVAYGPDGQIIAAIIIIERNGEAVIDELFTHPDHRRQGLAEELLRHCMHILHTLGRTTLSVTVEESNSPALALYLSRDFRRVPADDTDTD